MWVGMQFGVASNLCQHPHTDFSFSLSLPFVSAFFSLLLQAPTDGNTPPWHKYAAQLPPQSDIQILQCCLQECITKFYMADTVIQARCQPTELLLTSRRCWTFHCNLTELTVFEADINSIPKQQNVGNQNKSTI